MSSLLFMLTIVGIGIVIFWYVYDEAVRGGHGSSGILGMDDAHDKKAQKADWKNTKSNRPWRVRRH